MIPTKIIKPVSSAYQYQLLIGRLLEQPLKYKPDAEIVYRDKSRYTYRDLYKRVSRMANLLTGMLGIEAGETVGIIDYDSHRFLEGYFAIPMIGAVLHTINFRHSDEEILYAINLAEDKVIFCHRDHFPLLEKLRDQIPSLEKIVLISDETTEQVRALPYEGEFEFLLNQQKGEYNFPDFDENSVATIFFTTGTTGLPKAVYFSHRQLVLHTLALITTQGAMNSVNKISSDDVYMPMTPMFHVHAWGMPYIATYLGMKQVYPGKYEPAELLRLKRDEKVTVSHGVPTLLQMIVSHPDVSNTDLSGWKIVVGGSDLPRGLGEKILSLGIDVITGYGMSETGPAISLSYLDKKITGEKSEEEKTELRLKAGRSIHFSEVKIRNEAGEFLPHDGVTPGEVVIRSPWATGGYYKDNHHSDELWKDGYLHTGDIGTIDQNGVITIVDRIKDLVKSGGEWVSSSAVESLISSYPGIEEVAVIAAPDEKWTEHVLAIIVLKPSEFIDEKDLNDYLKQFVQSGKIKSFAIPKEYRFMQSLPKTSSGKIDKKKLRAAVVNRESRNKTSYVSF